MPSIETRLSVAVKAGLRSFVPLLAAAVALVAQGVANHSITSGQAAWAVFVGAVAKGAFSLLTAKSVSLDQKP